MKRLLYIRSLAMAALLLLLLAVAPAAAQNVAYQGETTTLAVVAEPDCNYKWELYNDGTGNLVDKPGNAQPSEAVFVGSPNQPSVDVRWLTPGIYYYKVTVTDNITGCSSNLKIGRMEVKEALPTATITSDHQTICDGDEATLEVTLTGKGPWDLTYSDDTDHLTTITGITESEYQLVVKPRRSTEYFITEVKDQNAVNSIAKPTKVWVFWTDRPVFVRKIHAVEP